MRLTNNKFIGFTLSVAFVICSFISASAQTESTQPSLPPCAGDKPIAERTLDEVLCLEDTQRKRIRLINVEMNTQLEEARRRMQIAQKVLDETIYGNGNSDDATVEQRAREFGAAQAEFVRIRSLKDFKVRRVLTPEQLRRFIFWRELQSRRNNQRIVRPLQNNRRVNQRLQNQNNLRQQNKQNNSPQTKPQANKKP